MTRPDSFLPNCDIIQSNEYTILLDIPGLSEDDVKLQRQNVYTIVKGERKRVEDTDETEFEKQERKFGDFTIRFKIPEQYERKWYKYSIDKGILQLKYRKDVEDSIIEKSEGNNSQEN